MGVIHTHINVHHFSLHVSIIKYSLFRKDNPGLLEHLSGSGRLPFIWQITVHGLLPRVNRVTQDNIIVLLKCTTSRD